MALNPFFSFDTLPATSGAAIREFQDRYLAGIGAAKPTGWADLFGDMIPTASGLVTFPVSQLRTEFKKTEGESHFKTLREASFDIKTQEFDEGYLAPIYQVLRDVYAYRKWSEAPGRLILAEEQHRHNQVALMLDGSGTRAGAVGSADDPGGVGRVCVDGVHFFAATHLVNIVDPKVTIKSTGATTWSNYQSTETNVLGSQATGNKGTFIDDYLQQEITSMKVGVPDENGNMYGADPDTIFVPTDYEEPLRNALANSRRLAFISDAGGASNAMAGAAVDNIYKGKLNVVGVKEFTQFSGSTADWYLVDSKMVKAGIAPWVSARETVPNSLALRVFDESSDYFKNTGNIKMSAHIWYGFGLALPHAIRRIKGPTR